MTSGEGSAAATDEGFLERIAGHLQSPLLTLDDRGRIASFNPAAAEVLGYSQAEVLGRDFDLLLPAELRGAGEGLRLTDLAAERGAVVLDEMMLATKSGEAIPLRVTAIAIPHMSGLTAVLAAVPWDPQRIKALQEEYLRMQNLAMVGELAATVAHEVRNPLASILAAIENLRDSLQLQGEEADSVRKILDQIQRLDSTVERLLLFARPWKPAPRSYDLAGLVQGVVEAVRREPGAGGIRFELHHPSPCPVAGDPQLIEHALANVLRNAVQALAGGGRVDVTVLLEGETVVARIHDDGPGIPVEHQATLFRPFFTTKVRGTGLGLATAKKAIEAHRGSIAVASAPGSGTDVEIRVPRAIR